MEAFTSDETIGGLESFIKLKALEIGFTRCGITTATPPPHHRNYRAWLGCGMAGEMHYLQRQEPRRADLEQVLPGVRSVVVVALNYYSESTASSPGKGVVARYARFDDYHKIIWERLEMLLDCVRSVRPGVRAKAYCDTGPITERDYAMRAGLGWIGKHTNLIDSGQGNWFFLGELLVDQDLIPDKPSNTHCGTCTRCIPACPTGAIVAPYQLDARRCISYLTIELKGSIPVDLRPLIGSRIYGCDDCLAACPWNRFAITTTDPALQPKKDLLSPDLVEMLSLGDEDFKARFANSPILRTKRRGFLRNVCVALGNVGEPSALPALATALRDHEPLIQEHAAWAIEQIKRRWETS